MLFDQTDPVLVSQETVLRYFLTSNVERLSSSPDRDKRLKILIDECLSIPEGDWDNFEPRLITYLNEAGMRNNPAIVWTIGNPPQSMHYGQVDHWAHATVRLGSLYSSGVNEEVNKFLMQHTVQGNLAKFAPFAKNVQGEFRLGELPEDPLRTIIGVLHPLQPPHQRIELIDGFHRATALINAGEQSVSAYVAIKK